MDDSGDTDFVNPVFISSIKIGMYTTFNYRPPFKMWIIKGNKCHIGYEIYVNQAEMLRNILGYVILI